MESPDIRFCRTADGTRIAWSAGGSGPPLVFANRWSFCADYRENPASIGLWLQLERERTLITFDRRGIGASRCELASVSIEDGIQDLEAVVEATGYERFDLLGDLDGSHMAAAYAVRHPERVRRLVLMSLSRQLSPVFDPPAMVALAELSETSWNLARMSMAAWGLLGGPSELADWLVDTLDRTMSAEVARRYILMLPNLDASEWLPRISRPTLVPHWRPDRQVALAEAQAAALIVPHARLAVLDGPGPLWMGDEKMVEPILQFLREGAEADRPGGLTEREMEILALLAAGRSNQEIARELSISARTAERHIGNIYPKIGARNRAEATAYALRSGIGQPRTGEPT